MHGNVKKGKVVMAGGRPPKFSSPEEMEAGCNAYFADCDANDIPYTITGLAMALDTFRDVLLDYEVKGEFSSVVRRAKQRVENRYERNLHTTAVAGSIFALKNMRNKTGWQDKIDTDNTNRNLNANIDVGGVDELTEDDKKMLKELGFE